ncbi:molybdate ABC transporter permease subunit [Iodobacter sp.]|uniref:molybdate ABC transporter permease subunit n=1 Tax=Iodobacter sp. TaxID=1915058 RepID=UPI0025CCC99D|nr:molybdate ABC transporter permease subunit [Iodobacter sp.]
MSPELFATLWLTLKLAGVTTLCLLPISIILARCLCECRSNWVLLLEIIVTLPIVLPPTVIGFYLLQIFAPQALAGSWWVAIFGQPLAFSFSGLVVGSILYSLPFAVQPIQTAIRGVSPELIESGRALGGSASKVFWGVVLPAARHGIYSGAALSFAHTVGEFGVVLMLGGNIAGETRVASIALFDATQRLDYASAHQYAIALLIVAALMVLVIAGLRRYADSVGKS